MRYNYKLLLAILVMGLGLIPLDTVAQDFTVCSETEAECLVEYHNGDFIPYHNALRNTILNDTLDGARKHPDRVYVLETGGTYFTVDAIVNQGFHLNIRSQTEAEVGSENYLGPARIQLKTDEAGGSAGRLMTVQGDLTLDGVFVTGMHDGGSTGNYLPIRVSADNARIVVKNSIFEQTDFALFGFDSQNNKVYIYDSMFRNHINKTQQWEGRGIRFEAGADTLIVENTTYMNLGMTVLQSEAGPINYTRFVHNTVINVGRIFNTGNFWKEAYVANNLFVNPYWHGEGAADQNPDREYPYTGFITVGPVGPGVGYTDIGRRMVVSNNAFWTDPQLTTYYSDSINAQPVFNALTDSMFNTFNVEGGLGSLYRGDNWVGTDPNIAVYHTAPDLGSDFAATEIPLEDLVPKMIANIRDLREARQSPFTDWSWDPGRNPEPSSYSVQGILPEFLNPGDFSYDNSTYLTAGTDGLPLGNLNYHDGARADWESNKASYMSAIKDLAGVEITTEVIGTIEAESGTLDGGAEAIVYNYPLEIFLQEGTGSGDAITWTFDMESAGDYTFRFLYDISCCGEKGNTIALNETALINDNVNPDYSWGMWFAADTTIDEYLPYLATDATGTVVAGENTLTINKDWGWMVFGDVIIFDGETAIDTLRANDAILVGQALFQQVNDSDPAASSGFYHVDLLNAGSSVTLNLPAEEGGTYLLSLLYKNGGDDSDVELTINGESSGTVTLTGTEGAFTSVSSNYIGLESGDNEVKISSVSGGVGLDNVSYFLVTGVANEVEEGVPNGFELTQNYPNPFNPTTNINFSLPASANVQLTVYNLLGQKVATLIDGRRSQGKHTVRFDARSLASGVYFYQLKAGDFTLQRKMTLIK